MHSLGSVQLGFGSICIRPNFPNHLDYLEFNRIDVSQRVICEAGNVGVAWESLCCLCPVSSEGGGLEVSVVLWGPCHETSLHCSNKEMFFGEGIAVFTECLCAAFGFLVGGWVFDFDVCFSWCTPRVTGFETFSVKILLVFLWWTETRTGFLSSPP